jgi:hypothetical protein
MVTNSGPAERRSPAARRRAEDVIKDIVGAVAPGELDQFDLISTAFFENPERALRGSPGRDKPAGYDVSELQMLVTMVVLNAFYSLLADEAKDASVRAGKGAWRWLKSRRKRKRKAEGQKETLDAPVAATQENASRLAEDAYTTMIKLGGSPDTAARVRVVIIDVVLGANSDDGPS